MPVQIEHEGEVKTFYTQAELDKEVAGLRVTLGQLKDEKADLKTKVTEAEAAMLNSDELAAKASGDNEALKRIADERDSKKQGEIDTLRNSISSEKVTNLLNGLVNKLGAGGSHNEDLRDLLKSRFEIAYDMDTHESRVSGDGVSNIAELEKLVLSSGRYDAYLAGTGSTGGDSQGSKSAGGAGVNPFSKESFNLTAQANMLRDNPTLAAQMKTQS
jgi:hypothetical protein